MQVKKQQLELNMNNGQVQNWRKAIYCHPASLTYMQSSSCEMLGWMEHKLESRLPGEIYYPYGRKQRGTEEPLDEGERGE